MSLTPLTRMSEFVVHHNRPNLTHISDVYQGGFEDDFDGDIRKYNKRKK